MSERTAGHSGLAHEFLLGGMPEARAGLDAAPEPKAVGAAADADALRAAYLDLLKLALCDLAGAGTTSVGAMPGKGVVSYELQGRDRRLRSAGIDWPLHGLTMVGLARLADLQSCVETVVRDRVPGDLIEAGVWRGGASILMRAVLDALGSTDRIVVVADSFEGFPDIDAAESDGVDYSYEFLVAALDDVRDNFARFGYERGVDFVPGFFEETLPQLTDRTFAVVRLDGDSYSATNVGLHSLYPALSPGGYMIIDDYGVVEGCRRAVDDFRSEYGITEPIEQVDWVSVRWRREGTDPLEVSPASPVAQASGATGGARRSNHSPRSEIPTLRELELAEEIGDLKARLAELDGRGNGGRRVDLRGIKQRLAAALRRDR
ncbi:MAG TPA: TylF/MycF/NovP-related O-methyltransferase [Pseudolysinimonas sp.]|nr:TylF/MycF/NovP-related O-methyltransferase [Pseudolysinimonas sp.]